MGCSFTFLAWFDLLFTYPSFPLLQRGGESDKKQTEADSPPEKEIGVPADGEGVVLWQEVASQTLSLQDCEGGGLEGALTLSTWQV
jgi:hypothetical protein